MKKKIAVLISFMMVLTFALAACGGGNADLSDSKYLGEWKADSLSLGEETGNVDGGEYTLTLNDDGTGTFVSIEDGGAEETSDITWSLTSDGFKTEGDAKMKFTDDGDGIKTTILGVDLHFVRPGENGEASGDAGVDGSAYGYAGDDPVECAVYKYMAEEASKDYDAADVSIPVVEIIGVDTSQADEIVVYGDFWVNNYNIEGDTLKCVSGGNYPGVFHMTKDYKVTNFDVVEDGGNFESSAKELFGDRYEDFMKIYSDSDKINEDRKITVSDYRNLNGLTEVTKMQDEGWDPVDLYIN